MTANRRIFLNIIATYGRSLYALVLGLFTARWALQALGHVDYGLYGVVAGLTAFIAYFNNILGGAIARYYAVSVGEQQKDVAQGLETCRMWFTTAVVIHTAIPLVLIVVGYPIGEWAVRNFLTIPADRVVACVWVWRFVCLSCFLSMVSVPFNAMYTAKQYIAELTIYSFITTTCNACFLYYIVSHPGVWLTKFALWQCLLGILPQLIIGARAYFIFPECRIVRKYVACWGNVKKLSGYAAGVAWGSLGAMLRDQGGAILVNKYFGPRVNAGMAIGNNLSAQTNTLSGSMIGAFSPAVFNAWGAGNYDLARKLAYQTCKLGTLFILVFAIPLVLEVDDVLRLWLKAPPQYAAGFCIFILAINIIDKLATGHMIAVNANGRILKYQAFVGTSLVVTLPIAWTFVKIGFGPYAVGWAMLLTMVVCALGRVWFARTLVGMSSIYWMKRILVPIVIASVICLSIGYVPSLIMKPSFVRICITTGLCEGVLMLLSWFVILDPSERAFIAEKINRYRKRFK